MTYLRTLVVAVAFAAGVAAAAPSIAAPANIGAASPPAAIEGETATPVHYRAVYCHRGPRWVWTHWGWRQRFHGPRCVRHHHYRPYHYRPYW